MFIQLSKDQIARFWTTLGLHVWPKWWLGYTCDLHDDWQLNKANVIVETWIVCWIHVLCWSSDHVSKLFASYFEGMVSCQKGPTHHAYAWQIRPFRQDTLDLCSHYGSLIWCPMWRSLDQVWRAWDKARWKILLSFTWVERSMCISGWRRGRWF